MFDGLIAEAIKGGDEPSVVGEAIVAAATDPRPKLRYPAGPLARRVSKAAPLRALDRVRQADPQDQPTQRSSKLPRPLARAEGIKRATVGASSAAGGVSPQGGRWGGTVIMSTTHEHAPTEIVDVGGIEFAYRRLGAETGVPLIFLHHLPDRRMAI